MRVPPLFHALGLRVMMVNLFLLGVGGAAGAQESAVAAVTVPAGSYRPLLVTGDGDQRLVDAFRLDAVAVTVGDFLDFVERHPEWRRSQARALFVGDAYLGSWSDDLDPGATGRDRPVTEVSWFAARAYCGARGGRLPTTDEWEYAASFPEAGASDAPAALHARFLSLQSARPGPRELPPVGRTVENRLGIWDLHGVIWEWTADFNNEMLSGAGRDDRGLDRGLFCAAGSVGVPDPSDYAGFLRSAFRTSLDGSRGGLLLGFRCAYPA